MVMKRLLSMKIRLASALVLLLAGVAGAQSTLAPDLAAPSVESEKPKLTIPVGTKVPLLLKQAISTKAAKEGDPVYAETAFPFVANDRIVIPAGTYIQGKITRVERGGRVKGRAQLLIHFTSMIYPNGYTVLLGGSVENAPGADKTSMKDSEGTIRQDSDAGRKAKDAVEAATTGTLIGAISGGAKGAGIGAGIGGVAGIAIALLTRGSDVRLDAGTSIEMEIQREVTVDASRIPMETSQNKAER
jgi:hypothetical protein